MDIRRKFFICFNKCAYNIFFKSFAHEFANRTIHLSSFVLNHHSTKILPQTYLYIQKSTFSYCSNISSDNEIGDETSKNVQRISELFKCDNYTALNLLQIYPKLTENLPSLTLKVHQLSTLIPIEILRKNIWILDFSTVEFEARLKEMKKWGLKDSEFWKFILILKLPSQHFYSMSSKFIVEKKYVPEGNRLLYMAREMECGVEEVVETIFKMDDLLLRNFSSIQETIEVLKEFDNKGEKFLKSMALLRLKAEKIRKRGNIMKKHDIPFLPWLITMSESNFPIALSHRLNVQKSKELGTVVDCLKKRLKLENREILSMQEIYPKLFETNVLKVDLLLAFLLECNYSIEEIKTRPHLFKHNLYKIKERYGELKSLGKDKPEISWLLCKQKKYYQIIEGLKMQIETN